MIFLKEDYEVNYYVNFYPHSTPFHVDLVICRHTFYFIFLPVLLIILIHYNFNVTSVSTEKPPWGVLINLYCIVLMTMSTMIMIMMMRMNIGNDDYDDDR